MLPLAYIAARDRWEDEQNRKDLRAAQQALESWGRDIVLGPGGPCRRENLDPRLSPATRDFYMSCVYGPPTSASNGF